MPIGSLTSWQLRVHLGVSKTFLSSKSPAVLLLFLLPFSEQLAFFGGGSLIKIFNFSPAVKSSPCASETNLAAEPPAVRDVLRASLPPPLISRVVLASLASVFQGCWMNRWLSSEPLLRPGPGPVLSTD